MPNLVGTDLNQIPPASDIGSLALQDNKNVVIDGGKITGSTRFPTGGYYQDTNISEFRPVINWDFVNTKVLDDRIAFYRWDQPYATTTAYTGQATYYDGKTFVRGNHNLVYYSEIPQSLTNLTANEFVITAPDGTLSGYQVFETATTNRHSITKSDYLSYNHDRQGIYTFSMFAKMAASGRNYLNISFYGGTNNWCAARFNISTGTLAAVRERGGGQKIFRTYIENVSNGWYRVGLTAQNRENEGAGVMISLATDITTFSRDQYGSASYLGETNAGMYWWGMQLERSSDDTEYMGEYVRTTRRLNSFTAIPKLITAKENQPRFDHNPTTGESLGLQLENAATNLMINSEPKFLDTQWAYYWQLQNYTTARPITIGGVGGTVIVPTNSYSLPSPWGIAWSGLLSLQTGVVNTSSANYRWSFYINPMTWVGNLYFATVSGDGNSGFGTAILLFDNGQYVADTAYIKYILPDGTYILRDIPNTYNTGASLRPLWYTTTVGNAWNKWWVGGIQYEAGVISTSYLPTQNRELRRRVEFNVVDYEDFDSWFNHQEGTLFIDVNLAQKNSSTQWLFGLGSGDANNYIEVYANTSNAIVLSVATQNSGESTSVSTTLIYNTRLRVALSYRQFNGFTLAVGGPGQTTSVITLGHVANNLPFMRRLHLGFPTYNWVNNYEIYTPSGYIRQFQYYVERLSDDELREMVQF